MRINEMTPAEMCELMMRESFGHLGCAVEGRPYIFPMYYAYNGKELYFFTTEGIRTTLNGNSQVCLQIEEIHDGVSWRSVIVTGRALRLTDHHEIDEAKTQIAAKNPFANETISGVETGSPQPATITFYRICAERMYGRKMRRTPAETVSSPNFFTGTPARIELVWA